MTQRDATTDWDGLAGDPIADSAGATGLSWAISFSPIRALRASLRPVIPQPMPGRRPPPGPAGRAGATTSSQRASSHPASASGSAPCKCMTEVRGTAWR